MALYEMRTYTLQIGVMAEATKLYTEIGHPKMVAGGHADKLVGYFIADTGPLNQLVHIWKFDDDADRRAFWKRLYSDEDFVRSFLPKIRPLLLAQENRLMHGAPWGPHP